MATYDFGPDHQPVYRLAVLLDDDKAGKEASYYLTAKHTNCQLWKDVFILQRRFPDIQDPKVFSTHVDKLNSDWKSLHCEIEDLLPKPVVDLFEDKHPKCFRIPPSSKGGVWHYEFVRESKQDFCSHVEELATLDDLIELIRLLKSLRFLLSVKPKDGSPIPSTS